MGRRLPDRRRRVGGASDRDRGQVSAVPGQGGVATQQPIQVRRVMETSPRSVDEMVAYLETAGGSAERSGHVSPRTCCATSRRRSSPSSPAGRATSTRRRTPSRRRSSRPPTTGRERAPARSSRLAPSYREPRLIDQPRSERAPDDREQRDRRDGADNDRRVARDDSLIVLFLCCHPVAHADVRDRPDAARRGRPDDPGDRRGLSRPRGDDGATDLASQATIKASGVTVPAADSRGAAGRARTVLRVLYLIFNEGYAASAGESSARRTRPTRPSASPGWSAEPPRRRRGRRTPGVDAAHGRASTGANRSAGTSCRSRTRTGTCGTRPHRRGNEPPRLRDRKGRGRRVPVPGGDRRDPRPRARRRRHRLAADPLAVRAPRTDDRQPGRHCEPGGRGGDGRRAVGRPRRAGRGRTER